MSLEFAQRRADEPQVQSKKSSGIALGIVIFSNGLTPMGAIENSRRILEPLQPAAELPLAAVAEEGSPTT